MGLVGTISSGQANVSSTQPLDADLTAIAALSTTAYGRDLLTLTDQAALRTAVGTASETAAGVIELATQAEVTAGVDTARAVTPATLSASIAPQTTGLRDVSDDLGVAAGSVVALRVGSVVTLWFDPNGLETTWAGATGALPASLRPPFGVDSTVIQGGAGGWLKVTAAGGIVDATVDGYGTTSVTYSTNATFAAAPGDPYP